MAIENSAIYEIYSYNFKSSNGVKRALNMWGTAAAEGRNVCLYDADSSDTQRWRAVQQSSGQFKLTCMANESFVLDRYQINQNADISANSTTYNNDQIFVFEPRGTSYYIKLASDGKYLTAVSNANGTSSGTSSTSAGNVYFSSSATEGSIWDVVKVSSSGSGSHYLEIGTICNQNYSNYSYQPTLRQSGCALCCGLCISSTYGTSVNNSLDYFMQHYWPNGYNWQAPNATFTEASYSLSAIKAEIDAGYLVAIHGINPNDSSNQHWVVAYGYTNNASSTSDIIVANPWNDEDQPAGRTAQTLAAAMNSVSNCHLDVIKKSRPK